MPGRSIVVLAVSLFAVPFGAFAQKVSFGVVTGSSLTDDFPTGSAFNPSNGNLTCGGQPCPSATVFGSDASKRLTIGPRLELQFSDHFFLEVEALHRAVRRKSRTDFSPPIDFGNGVIISSLSSVSTDYTWVTGKTKISPAARYTRWSRDSNAGTSTKPDQVELLVGFSF